MVRKEVVTARLEKLRGYLDTLRAVQKHDLQQFKSDPFIHGTAERYLHLSIESLLDIGNHIVKLIWDYRQLVNGKRPIGKETAKKLAAALNIDYRIFL